jgi:uncharacterized membrane protein
VRALWLCLLLGAAAPAYAQSFGAVSAILQQRCVVCHQGEAAPVGLRLDSHAALMKGSSRGPVVRPGDPAASEIVRRVRGQSLPRMPLTGPPWLSEKEIALIADWIAAGAPAGEPAAAAPPKPRLSAEQPTYADVAPILVGRCAKCHSANGLMGRPPEGYRLDTFEATLDAGERARVVPGNPDASELVRRIRGQSRPRMPFDGPPFLSEDEIRLIERWIAQGARDAAGRPTPVPAGARVRFRGDEEVRGTLAPDGNVRVERVRRRR